MVIDTYKFTFNEFKAGIGSLFFRNMFNKKISLASLSIIYLLTSCSGGGGGGPTTVTRTPAPAATAQSFATPVPNKTPYSNFNNPLPSAVFTEPVTQEQNPDPNVQFASYNKILRAIPTGDFAYIFKEYDAGGLKITAVKGENDFADYPLNFSISSLLQNTGTVGLKTKNVLEMTAAEKTNMLEKLFKHILIYGARVSSNRLAEFVKTSAADSNKDFSAQLAGYTAVYFYGNNSGTPADNSIAKMALQIDSNNGTQSFQQIVGGISMLQKASATDPKAVIDGKNMVEKGLLKMLYIAVLEKAAVAIPAKNAAGLDDAEIYYFGIREHAKSLDNIKTTRIEQLLGDRDFKYVNYPTLEKYLNAGFHEKAMNEMQNAINRIDSSDGQNSAVNAQLYIDLMNCSYENKKYKRVENAVLKEDMQTFVAAINSKNTDLANALLKKVQTSSRALI